MKILAIGAHPDDIEIFMYGFLASCKSRGDEIYMIVATDGGAGKVIEKSNIVEIRKNETIMGLKKLGSHLFKFS